MRQLYKTPFGDYNLKRIPDIDKNLQAWNSADTYLLNHLFEMLQDQLSTGSGLDLEKAKILILNDDFGALTLPMAQFGCDSYSDSFISHLAIRKNLKVNCPYSLDKVNFLKSTDILEQDYDVVLFKNVKTLALLQDEMLKLAAHIKPDTLLLGASMARNLQKSTLETLSKTIGEVQSSLTWKKARLIHVQFDPVRYFHLTANQQVTTDNIVSYQLEGGKEVLHNLANVFSRNKLDIGSRFFLQHFPPEKSPQPDKRSYKKIIDLGCGNGVLALKAAQKFPGASIICVDESYMALASAKLTLEANVNTQDCPVDYISANALTDFKQNSVELILCNPPFHQQYALGDATAWQMFKQAKETLVKGGELWIVGNRHLGYHLKLKKIFGNQKLIAANNKFVVLKAVKH